MTVFHKITWEHLVQLANGGHDKFLPSLGNDDVRYMVNNIRSSFTEGKLFQPEAPKGQGATEEAPSEWDIERVFWDTCAVDTYDLEHQGGYDSYNAMVKQKPGHLTAGEWVRAEDYRRDLAAAKARIAEADRRARTLLRANGKLVEERNAANARADAAERHVTEWKKLHGEAAKLWREAGDKADQLAARVKELEEDRERMQGAAIDNAGQRDYAHGFLCVIRDALNEPLYTNQVEEGATKARALVRQFFSGIGALSVCTPEERAVLEAMGKVPEWVLTEMADPEDIQDARPYYVALGQAELANRAAKAKVIK